MILGINTAQTVHELALIDSSKEPAVLITEKTWTDGRRDVEDLVPFLNTLLEEHGLSKKDITQIVVVRGPGSFTSLRTGVAFANALAEGLGAQLFSLDTFELLRRKAALTDPNSAKRSYRNTVPLSGTPSLVLLHAGGLDVGVFSNDDPVRVGPLAMILNDYPHDKNMHVVAELTETQREELNPIVQEKKWKLVEGHELLTMGEMLLTFDLKKLDSNKTVEPYYLKCANITKSSDPWKK